jgi:ubiquinone/menaquinone biosynthesis C-methylase UbiE
MPFALPGGGPEATHAEACDRHAEFSGATVLDLGCGAGGEARRIAASHPVREVIGVEADERQHAANAAVPAQPRLRFLAGRAEALPLADGSIDVALLFKSLHHVPPAAMDQAFAELARVVRPGGTVIVAEPVCDGAYDELVRLFNDEHEARAAAFAALERAAESPAFELAAEAFYRAPVHYRDFDDFARRMLQVSYRETTADAGVLAAVRERFARAMGPDGAHYLQHMRADVLRRRG